MNEQEMNRKAVEAYPNIAEQAIERNAFRKGYKECYKEIESLPKLRGWVTKTDDGVTLFHTTSAKPEKGEMCWFGNEGDTIIDTENNLFPELTFNDEPIEVELLIRKV